MAEPAEVRNLIIVGSGPGGSTFADAVTAAGWDCIVLEKGRNHLLDLEPPYELRGEYSNDEVKFLYRNFLGPDHGGVVDGE